MTAKNIQLAQKYLHESDIFEYFWLTVFYILYYFSIPLIGTHFSLQSYCLGDNVKYRPANRCWI